MKTELVAPHPCPSCGQPLPSGVLEGLCPRCLLARGTETEEGSTPRPRFEAPPVAEVAALFPQLEILGLLGAGGMGAVYRARQPALDRIVALKVLPADDAAEAGGAAFAERFNREARALARLNHPNIVAVYEFGRAGHLHFFLMEFVDGANLRQLLKAQRLSPREALQIIPQVCDALQYAHDAGVVHRDIKPENVLLDRRGRVKIADFGLAKIRGTDVDAARLTGEGQVMGTPHYMAPEQLERPLAVDHRADIYSLGVVFYEMLTGDLPLGRFSPPSRKVEIDVRLDEVVLRALENDPNRRYQQADEVKTQVETIASAKGGGEAPRPDQDPVIVERPERRWSWAGFPLVVERGGDGRRRLNGAAAARATAVVLGAVTALFTLLTTLAGGSVLGWLGVVGWRSFVPRILLSLGIVAWAILRTWQRPDPDAVVVTTEPDGSRRVCSPDTWWSRHWRGVASITPYVALWVWFQFGWLMPQFERWAGIQAAAHVAEREPESGILSAPLPGGGALELLGITDPDSASQAQPEWWRADGSSLPHPHYSVPAPGNPRLPLPAETMRRTLVLRTVRSASGTAPVVYDFEPNIHSEAGSTFSDLGGEVSGGWTLQGIWSVGSPKATLRFGYALGAWQDVVTYTPSATAMQEERSTHREWFFLRSILNEVQPRELPELLPNGDFRVSFGPDSHALLGHLSASTTVAPGSRARNWHLRVVARNQDGIEQEAIQASQGGPEVQRSQWTFHFGDWTAAQIRDIRVEAQLLHWVEFPDVALRPPSQPAFQTTATRYVPTPTPAPGLLAEAPRLRFLAWQTKTNDGSPVWHHFLPNGTEANPMDRQLQSRLNNTGWVDLTGTAEGRSDPPILHLWFSHPLLDARSWVGIERVDDEGKPVPLGAGGSMGSSYFESPEAGIAEAWVSANFCPGERGQLPQRLHLRLLYCVGEPDNFQEVPVSFNGSMSLPHGGMLSGIGETPDRKAFLALASNSREAGEFRIIVRAKTTDERLWESSGSQLAGPANGFLTARYEFAFPIAVTRSFLVGARPIRRAVYQDVVLPPLTP